MNEHPNAAIVRSVYEAVVHGDMETFAAALDDDIVWHESVESDRDHLGGRRADERSASAYGASRDVKASVAAL